MFGKNAAKQQGALAQAQQQQASAAVATASQPTPLQTTYEKSNLDFLNEIKAPGFDVTKSAAMNPYLSLYTNAVNNRFADRAGKGIVQLGTNTQSPDQAAAQARLYDERRQESAAGALSDAFNRRYAEASGSVVPLTSLTQNRTLGVAGLASSNANNAWARYLAQQQGSGFLNSNLFRILQQGAQNAAAAGGQP
jgi:hypothetical protein